MNDRLKSLVVTGLPQVLGIVAGAGAASAENSQWPSRVYSEPAAVVTVAATNWPPTPPIPVLPIVEVDLFVPMFMQISGVRQ